MAASMVTTLKAYGIASTETEMAHLSHTEVNGGTTDSRAVAGLETKLVGQPIEVCYERMAYNRLKAVPKPCMVSIKWDYFVSHMVPVLEANDECVRVGDPLKGIYEMPVNEFRSVWHKSGIYLVDRRPNLARKGETETYE